MSDNIRYSVIVNLVRTLVLTILSFISFPYICKALGAEMMGTYTWANTFVYYFLILARAGIPNVAIRECAKVQNDKEALSRKAQEFFILQGILTILSFGVMCALVFSIKELANIKEIIFILSINFVIGVFSFEWIFIALEKHYFISIRSIVTIGLSSLLMIGLIHHPTDIFLYSILAILSTVLTVVINVLFLKNHITLKYVGKYNLKQYIKPLFTVFIIALMLTLYNSTDSFILGFLDKSKAAVASYSVGIKSVEIVITLITSLDAVFIPRASKYYKLENKTFFSNLTRYGFNICFFIAIPAIFSMAASANEITYIISGGGSGYSYSNIALIILVSMTLTFSLADMIYEQVLLPMKKEKYYMITLTISTFINITLSLVLGLLFNDYPIIGVAIATMLSDIILLLCMILLARQYVIKAIFNKNNLKILIGGLLVLLSSLLITRLLNIINPIITIILVIVIGALVYLFTLALLKENLVMSFIRKKSNND